MMSIEAIATASASPRPQTIATGRTARTLKTGTCGFRMVISTVVAASTATLTSTLVSTRLVRTIRMSIDLNAGAGIPVVVPGTETPSPASGAGMRVSEA
jgi:hypothetical protein